MIVDLNEFFSFEGESVGIYCGDFRILLLLSPEVGDKRTVPKMSKAIYKNTVVPVIGFYDGMFGPGSGSFFSLAGVSLRG